jgi:type IV secretory pathway VirB4 component
VCAGSNPAGGTARNACNEGDPWNLYSRTSYTAEPSGRRLVTNGNILILGAPGNGKSALVKTFAYRQAAFGRRAEFIDPKGEYASLVQALGGTVVALKPGGEQSLNPLTDVGDARGRKNLLLSLCRALLGRGLEPVEEAGLVGALKQADAAAGDREVCLPDVEAALRDPGDEITKALNASAEFAREELRNVMLKLYLLREGPLAGMFDRPTNIADDTWDRRAIAIDLSAVAALAGADDAGQNLPLAITMMCCSAFLTAKAIQRAKRYKAEGRAIPKTLRINDEGWRVLAVPGQAQQYQSDFKLQRASGVVNVVIMHRFSDLQAAGDEGSRAAKLAEGLLADADTVIIYKQAEAEMADVEAKVHLTESESTVVENLEPGQALWLVGKWRGLVHHLRSSTEARLSDTDDAMASNLPEAGDRRAIDALAGAAA